MKNIGVSRSCKSAKFPALEIESESAGEMTGLLDVRCIATSLP